MLFSRNWRTLCFFLLVFSLNACKAKPRVLTSKDGKVQLTVFGMVPSKSLHQGADLQAANFFMELYVIVFNEPKKDFPGGVDLKRYDAIVRGSMKKKLGLLATVKDPKSVKVHKYNALQGSLHGSVQSKTGMIKVGYLLTTIETHDSFHQILAWTLDSRFASREPDFVKMADSFRRIDTPSGASKPRTAPNPSRTATSNK